MLRNRKHITALVLLLLMVMPLFFSVTVMVKQKILQFQREERFESEEMETIKVAPENIHWVKAGKEAIIDGELFDVESYEKEGDKILLTGFYDNKEEKLVSHIKDIHRKDKHNSPFNQSVTKFVMVPFYHESSSFSLLNSWQIIARRFSSYTELIQKVSYTAPTPPPKITC